MNNFLGRMFLDNSIRDYLVVIAIILFVFLFKRYLSKYFAGLLFKIVTSIFRAVEKPSFVNLIIQPLGIFLLVFVTMIAFDKLSFPSVLKFHIYKVSFHI